MTTTTPFALGHHWLIEAYGCDINTLSDVEGIQRVFHLAAVAANMTIINECYHLFEPHGVSGMTIVSESHLSVHTWPEYKYAAIDIFVCGEVNIQKGIDVLKSFFKWEKMEIKDHPRGIKSKLLNDEKGI